MNKTPIRKNRELAAKAYEESKDFDGIDFDQKIQDIATRLLGLSGSEVATVSYVSFLIFECENRVTDMIFHIMKATSENYNSNLFFVVLNELSFGQKIKIYEKLLKQYPDFYPNLIKGVKFFYKMNDVRNDLFHSKNLKNMKYNNKSIADAKVKLEMMSDYLNAIGINESTI